MSVFYDLNHPKTLAFAQHAHEATLRQFAQSPEFYAIKADVLAHLRDEKQIPYCQEYRAKMYHFHQSAEEPKGVYRVTSASNYRAGLSDWHILFRVADFDAILGDDVYLSGVSHCVEQPNRVLLSLSPAGSDSAYTLEFDLDTQQVVQGGFNFPVGKNHIAWRDINSIWVCPAWDEQQLSVAGYPREAWIMQRGQTFDQAQCVYQMDKNSFLVTAWRYLDAQGAFIDLIESATGFFTKKYWQVDAQGNTHLLNLPDDCEIVGYLAGQLLIRLQSNWQRANQTYAQGSLLTVKLNKGELGEARVLFVPNEKQALESVETTKHFIVASILDNVANKLRAWKWQDGVWQEHGLPELPTGAINITDQPWGGDVLYLACSDFTTPVTLYVLDLNVMELSILRKQQQQFDADGIVVQQHHAISADSTPIPYYHVGKQATADTPTLVYVYGGFGMPELPHYLGSIGRHWLQKGYAFVVANVRGGGEFPNWHQSAQKQNKHKTVDDLLAVIEDLVQKGYSSAKKIAIQGGSNGGLVVASAFVRAPESMGAMVCEVPLTDMLNYTKLSAGASWIDEYGDPEDPEMHEYLKNFSPLYQLNEDKRYPSAFITTSLSDDRVHPAHALQFYERLKAINPNKTWLYASTEGGHTGNSTQEQTAEEFACLVRFLEQQLQS